MTWNPSQQRAPQGVSAGGQWISAAAAKAAAKKAGTKKAAAAKKAPTAKAAKSSAPKLGPARNAEAAKAQADKQAQQLYAQAMGMDATQRAALLKKLPPDQLEKLTAILYSSPTSDRSIVAARIAVANEMSKRGLDVTKYGALGGGHGSRPTAARKALPRLAAKKAAPKAAAGPSAAAQAAATARAGSQVHATLRARAQ